MHSTYDTVVSDFKDRLYVQTKSEFEQKALKSGMKDEYFRRVEKFKGLTVDGRDLRRDEISDSCNGFFPESQTRTQVRLREKNPIQTQQLRLLSQRLKTRAQEI